MDGVKNGGRGKSEPRGSGKHDLVLVRQVADDVGARELARSRGAGTALALRAVFFLVLRLHAVAVGHFGVI